MRLWLFWYFALSVEKIRIKFDLCVFGCGIGFCAKTAFVILLWMFVIKYKMHPTYKICFDRYGELDVVNLLLL